MPNIPGIKKVKKKKVTLFKNSPPVIVKERKWCERVMAKRAKYNHGEDVCIHCRSGKKAKVEARRKIKDKMSNVPSVPILYLESRWNSVQEYDLIHREGLSHQLGALFDSERDCDLNISVMADNLTLNTVCAHSLILSLNPDLRRYQPDFSSLTVQTTSNCSQHAHTFVRYE